MAGGDLNLWMGGIGLAADQDLGEQDVLVADGMGRVAKRICRGLEPGAGLQRKQDSKYLTRNFTEKGKATEMHREGITDRETCGRLVVHNGNNSLSVHLGDFTFLCETPC